MSSAVEINNVNDVKNIEKSDVNKDENGVSWFKIVLIAVTVILILLTAWYAYENWKEDDEDTEGFIEGNRQERTDPQNDFNLQEAIQELENLQDNVLKTLSGIM